MRSNYHDLWKFNIENMQMAHPNENNRVICIKYDEVTNTLYYLWEDRSYSGWDECVPEIKDSFLRARDEYIESILLGKEVLSADKG